jgi:hypothetical protein
LLSRLRDAGDEAAEAMAATRDLVRALRERVEGLQVTVLHGAPAAAERLLSDLIEPSHERKRHHA